MLKALPGCGLSASIGKLEGLVEEGTVKEQVSDHTEDSECRLLLNNVVFYFNNVVFYFTNVVFYFINIVFYFIDVVFYV